MSILYRGKGFTLFEILVAMTLLSIALLGMSLLIVGVISGNLLSDMRTTATTLAQDKMEHLKALGYSSVTSETQEYNTIPDYPKYKRVTTVTPSPVSGMKTITVTVYWDSSKRSVVLSSLMAP